MVVGRSSGLIPVVLLVLAVDVLSAATPAESIALIRKVGTNAESQKAATAAVAELSKGDEKSLLPILTAFDGASPLAANWLRGVFEAVADRALQNKRLPAKALEDFTVDTKHNPAARRMAYEWLLKVDPTAADRLIPGMLLDPSAEFRRDAVARELALAEKLKADEKKDAAIAAFQKALSGAVDDDQVKAIVVPLREYGETVDLQKHFGFIAAWRLIGPFDNTDKQGFDVAYPPESELNFDKKYAGKGGEIGWTEHATEDEYGIVNLAKALAPHKGAITYATTEFVSPKAQSVDIRLGTPNAWKLWVNGQLIFARDEYHRGTQLDQYRVQAPLKAGKNTLLLKVCQNEQTEEWAQDWKYQLRICDGAGSAILPADAKTSRREATSSTQLVQGDR